MDTITINRNIFKVKYLPDFAKWILENKLEEYVLVSIRYCREANLPLIKALDRLPEQELVQLSVASNKAALQAIADNKIAELVDDNAKRWLENSIGFVDKEEIVAEDLTIGFHIRRKTYSYFLDAYTKNAALHRLIMEELDVYTTYEELVSYTIFLQIQQEKISKATEKIEIQKQMLLEAQELADVGSCLIDYRDQNNSIFTEGYKKIFEFESRIDFDLFLSRIHPEDISIFKEKVSAAMVNGGDLEIEYRYLAPSGEKRIWSRSRIESENGKPVCIKSTIRDITEKHNLISELKKREQLFEKAQELTLIGNWSWELSTGEVTWSKEMYKLFEMNKNFKPKLADFINFVHPDDREAVKMEMQRFNDSPKPMEYIFKIITPKGNTKVIRGLSELEMSSSKVIVRCFGTCQDITESEIMKRIVAKLQ